MIILEYDRTPGVSADQKVSSLMESVQRALDDIAKNMAGVSTEEIQKLIDGSQCKICKIMSEAVSEEGLAIPADWNFMIDDSELETLYNEVFG